jgi:hypothetical protein
MLRGCNAGPQTRWSNGNALVWMCSVRISTETPSILQTFMSLLPPEVNPRISPVVSHDFSLQISVLACHPTIRRYADSALKTSLDNPQTEALNILTDFWLVSPGKCGIIPGVDHDQFLPNPFQFILAPDDLESR